MKILQFTSTYPPIKDGVGDFSAKLKRLFDLNKIMSSVIASSNVPANNDISYHLKNFSIIELIRSAKLLSENNNTLLIFHYPTTFYGRKISISLVPIIFRLFGIKVISYLHEYYIYSKIGRLRILPILLFSNFIICVDELSYRAVNKKFNKVAKIPGGVNLNVELIKKFSWSPTPSNRIRLLYFGFIKYGKGLENLFDVFNDLESENPFYLNVVGDIPDSKDQKSIELFDLMKRSKNCTYVGYLSLEELFKFIQEIDFVIFPFKDGLSEKRGSFMTAMALGIPVITTKPKNEIPGLKNLYNVIYIENDSYTEISRCLELLKTIGEEKKCEIGLKAKQWFETNYSDEIIFQKINAIIEQYQ